MPAVPAHSLHSPDSTDAAPLNEHWVDFSSSEGRRQAGQLQSGHPAFTCVGFVCVEAALLPRGHSFKLIDYASVGTSVFNGVVLFSY